MGAIEGFVGISRGVHWGYICFLCFMHSNEEYRNRGFK